MSEEQTDEKLGDPQEETQDEELETTEEVVEDDTEPSDGGDDTDYKAVSESKSVAIKEERELRKEYEKKVAELEKELAIAKAPETPKKAPSSQFKELSAKVTLQEILDENPEAKHVAGDIRKILFEERPYLQDHPTGVQDAVEMALGRNTKVNEGKEVTDDNVKPQTSETPVGGKAPKTGKKSPEEIAQMSQREFEDYQSKQHAAVKKKLGIRA